MVFLLFTRLIAYVGLDYQRLASILQAVQNCFGAGVSPITYNPVKETITLTGFSKQGIEQAKQEIQSLLTQTSELWGGKYLLKSPDTQFELPKCLSSADDSSGTPGADNSDQTKIFPVIPKDDWRLAELWLEHILPTLPRILNPKLGRTYTASLVLRGANATVAHPCIQIESPYIPKQEAQDIIRDELQQICKKANYTTTKVHFSHGSVRKLSGGADEIAEDGAGAWLADQQLHFNCVRPYSKPGMGASLGLLCSDKVAATLGGYVLLGGKKYILTSEHFVAKSQDRKDDGCQKRDLGILISPAHRDLHWLKESLEQNMRDVKSEIDRLVPSMYGDQEIPVEYLDNPTINAKRTEKKEIEILLGQVNKPSADYTIGSVFKRCPEPVFERSVEPSISTIPRSTADIARLGDNQTYKYHMDWSLFNLTDGAAEVGENRHKYQSNKDAREELYINEKDHTKQPGDICYQTCSADSGISVYYVGQGSKYRQGIVHLPCFTSRNSSQTIDWAIRDFHGGPLPYNDVAGDSGAWVIRKRDNALMGQIHSHSADQVLFTPIDIIFEDIKAACGTDIMLPPCPFDRELVPMTAVPKPLCSTTSSSPSGPLPFFKRQRMLLDEPPKLSPLRTILSETSKVQFPREHPSQIGSISLLSQASPDPVCESPSSSLPALTDSSQYSESSQAPLKSSLGSENADILNGQDYVKQLLSESWPEMTDGSTSSEVSYFPNFGQQDIPKVNLACDNNQMKTQLDFHTKLSARVLNWLADYTSNLQKARSGSGLFRLFSSQLHDAQRIGMWKLPQS